MKRRPREGDLRTPTPGKSAKVDNGSANAAVTVNENISYVANGFVCGCVDLLAKHTLKMLVIDKDGGRWRGRRSSSIFIKFTLPKRSLGILRTSAR